MGLFSKFGKKKEAAFTCSVSGEAIGASKIEDETFASGMLGYTVGIQPSEGKVYAPPTGQSPCCSIHTTRLASSATA